MIRSPPSFFFRKKVAQVYISMLRVPHALASVITLMPGDPFFPTFSHLYFCRRVVFISLLFPRLPSGPFAFFLSAKMTSARLTPRCLPLSLVCFFSVFGWKFPLYFLPSPPANRWNDKTPPYSSPHFHALNCVWCYSPLLLINIKLPLISFQICRRCILPCHYPFCRRTVTLAELCLHVLPPLLSHFPGAENLCLSGRS